MKANIIKKAGLLVAMTAFAAMATACVEERVEEEVNDDALTNLLILSALSNSVSAGSTTPPRIRFTNSSGSTESYALHSGFGCTGSTIHTYTENPVSASSTTAYASVTAGSYYISFNAPVTSNCRTGSASFSNGRSYTCTSGVTTITCAID